MNTGGEAKIPFRQTKIYDLMAGLPLAFWFGLSARGQCLRVLFFAHMLRDGQGGLLAWLQLAAAAITLLFYALLVVFIFIRRTPALRAQGIVPRFAAVAGTFLAIGIIQLPPVELPVALQVVVVLMVTAGMAGSAVALLRLGRSFSIMPEARALVTDGVYGWVRHPLYAAESLGVIGTMLQFRQPWAILIGIAVLAILYARTHYEEQVLEAAYPDYASYRARVRWRFIPGLL